MKRSHRLLIIALPVVFALLLSGCARDFDELREENENLNKVIDNMTDEINSMRDKASDLVSEAEENWKLLQECIDEKQEIMERTVVITASKETVDVDSWTLMDSSMHDITGDKVVDQINLYTSAIKDENGNMMWDDGQYFLLTLYDGEKSYSLFNERVQLGRAYYSVFDGDDAGVFIMVSTYAGMRVAKFMYSAEDGHFIGRTVFDTDDINIIHTTIPWD